MAQSKTKLHATVVVKSPAVLEWGNEDAKFPSGEGFVYLNFHRIESHDCNALTNHHVVIDPTLGVWKNCRPSGACLDDDDDDAGLSVFFSPGASALFPETTFYGTMALESLARALATKYNVIVKLATL